MTSELPVKQLQSTPILYISSMISKGGGGCSGRGGVARKADFT